MFSFFTKSIVRVFNSVVLLSIVVGLAAFTLIIGYYNYDTSMNDLRSKAKNTGDLASISLMEALWNFDEAGMQNIFTAILLDKDVVAIRVMKADSQTASAERIRELDAKTPFADLMKNPSNLETTTPIMREGAQIAQVQIITSTEKVKALPGVGVAVLTDFAIVNRGSVMVRAAVPMSPDF